MKTTNKEKEININVFNAKLKLRDDIIDKQRQQIKLLQAELQKKRQWWKLW